jgi:hypothetical protein
MATIQRNFNLVREGSRQDCLPVEILDDPPIVWLGTDSNDTIPVFARALRDQITFIDTAIDCTEHIASLSAPQRSIVLIMSDEYTIHRKEIEDMLSLFKIKMIYMIVDTSQSNPDACSLRSRRLKYIFNDTSSVLKQLCHDRVQRSVHLGMSMPSDKQNTKSSDDNIITDADGESIRIKQSSLHRSTRKPAPNAQIVMPEKVEQWSSSWKGFVIVAYQLANLH